jgi:hypothetical protein
VRYDYQELIQLSLLYLGDGSAVIRYNRPGADRAVHNAFSEQVPLAQHQQLPTALLVFKPKEDVVRPQNRYGSSEGKPQCPELAITTVYFPC